MGVQNILRGETKEIDVGSADIGKWILETLESEPDFVGQVDPVTEEKSTYGGMLDESIRCALWLRKQGLKPGDIICTFTYNHLYTYIPIFATLYNRAVYSPWNCGLVPQMIEYALNTLKPKFIFAEKREAEIILKLAKENNLDLKIVVFTKIAGMDSLKDILRESTPEEVDNFSCTKSTNADDDGFLFLTSGTSGDMSKIVLLSYNSVFQSLHLSANKTQTNINVILNFLPMAWMHALMKMLVNTLTFSKRIVVNEISYDIQEALRYIQKYKVTIVYFGLGMIHQMHRLKQPIEYDTSSLKLLDIGGVKHSEEILEMLMGLTMNGHVDQGYGATECAHEIFRGEMDKIDLNSCGYLCQNVELKVIDLETGAILGPNEKGEFCYRSPSIMKGYFKDQTSTDKVIDSEGWFHSGDLGYYDESGLGYVLGRVKNMSIHDGKIVPSWDVERVLFLNSEIVNVVTMPIGSSNDIELFVFVTVMTGSKVTEEGLCDIVKGLSIIAIPLTVKIVDDLPLTERGKIRMTELKRIAESIKKNRNQ